VNIPKCLEWSTFNIYQFLPKRPLTDIQIICCDSGLYISKLHLELCVEILPRDSMLTCVADIAAIKKYKPHSATTNFSFILAAIKKPEHQQLLDIAIEYGKSKGELLSEQIDAALDRLNVEFGRAILQIVPGTVSTAMEAKYAFDTIGSVTKALQLLDVSHDPTIFQLILRF